MIVCVCFVVAFLYLFWFSLLLFLVFVSFFCVVLGLFVCCLKFFFVLFFSSFFFFVFFFVFLINLFAALMCPRSLCLTVSD